jgi:hypothetical protein
MIIQWRTFQSCGSSVSELNDTTAGSDGFDGRTDTATWLNALIGIGNIEYKQGSKSRICRGRSVIKG